MKKVLIVVDTSRLTGRDLLRGAERFFSTFAQWEVHTLDPNYLPGDFSKELQQLDLRKFDSFFICCTENISSFLKVQKPKIIHFFLAVFFQVFIEKPGKKLQRFRPMFLFGQFNVLLFIFTQIFLK